MRRTCETCAHEGTYWDRDPCCNCFDWEHWTPKPKTEPKPEPAVDPEPMERACQTCAHEGTYWLSKEPCVQCDEHRCHWTPKPATETEPPKAPNCSSCDHCTGDTRNWPCCDYYSSACWTPKPDPEDTSEVLDHGSCDASIDSKIAAGSKKSAPFLLALEEVWKAFATNPPGFVHDREAPDAFRSFEIFDSWLARRDGRVCSSTGVRSLARLALGTLDCLGLEVLPDGTTSERFFAALREVWRVAQFGEIKHGPNNWMNAKPDGMWHYEAALWRHWVERQQGEMRAEDSGCYHWAHAAWNALMLLEMELRGVINPDWRGENDDGKNSWVHHKQRSQAC
jgi:hypothetical protein